MYLAEHASNPAAGLSPELFLLCCQRENLRRQAARIVRQIQQLDHEIELRQGTSPSMVALPAVHPLGELPQAS
jgi:hypothetical protein